MRSTQRANKSDYASRRTWDAESARRPRRADGGGTVAEGSGPATIEKAAWGMIDRPALRDRFAVALLRRVCVVRGVGGWGKTTAVSLGTAGRRVAWVSCEHADASALLRHVQKSIVEQMSSAAAPPALPEPRDPAGVAAMLCAWLQESVAEDAVLVLDDLEALDPNGGGEQVVEEVCRHGPENLHMVLVSRQELPFSLERLRGRGQLAEIDARELALDFAEVAALLRATIGDHPDGLAGRLWERTAGWPAAVIAAVDQLRGLGAGERWHVLDSLTRPGEPFHSYLTAEVVGEEPPLVRALMRRLAAFGHVGATEGALAPDSAPRDRVALADLIRRGLVRRSASGGSRWTLVAPLADYFIAEGALPAETWAEVHHATAQECLVRGARAEALRHWATASRWSSCATLLIEHGPSLVNTGQADAVLAVADDLPEQYQVDPRVQAVFGDARKVRGEWAEALACYARARTDDDPTIVPRVAWRLMAIAYAQGEFADVREVVGRTHFDREDTADEVRVLAMAAAAHRMNADLDGMRLFVQRAGRAASRCAEPTAQAAVEHVRGLLAAAEGDRHGAMTHHRAAVSLAEAAGDLLQELWIKLWHAFHLQEQGASRAAVEEAGALARRCEACEIPFLAALASTTEAQARARLGMLDSAAEGFIAAIGMLQRLGSRFAAAPMCGLGDLHRIRGHLGRAGAAYEEALALAEPNGDVFSLESALSGLARLHAIDDQTLAEQLAKRALELREGLREPSALLTRGWVALLGGDRSRAATDAARAGSVARARHHQPALAEAITLLTLAGARPSTDAAALGEAIDIYHDCGYRLDEAATKLVATSLVTGGRSTRRSTAGPVHAHADAIRAVLVEAGVELDSPRPAGPLAVLLRAAPRVAIKALGVFQVLRDGEPLPSGAWQSRKARELLKILVARRGPAPREQLMELLWPEADPAKAGNRLSVLLSTVRDVLTPDPPAGSPIDSDGSTIWLDPAHVSVDVEDFLARATVALAAHRRGDSDATEALRATAESYTGAFLEEDPYAEWAMELSEELRATYLAVLRALISRLRPGGDGAGDVDAALAYMLRLLVHDPYDEETHLGLIAMLGDSGRHGEARRRQDTYIRRLREIGLDRRPDRPPVPAVGPRSAR